MIKEMSYYLLLLASFITSNIILSTKWLKVVKVDVNILNPVAKGFKIIQISDLHSNSKSIMNVNIWKTIKKLDFNIAVITGDIVNSNADELNSHLSELKELAAKVPTFFCLGNHDYRACHDTIKSKLKAAGVIVLDNEKASIKDPKTDKLIFELIGLSDYQSNNYENIQGLFLPIDSKIIKVVIAHQPQTFDIVKDYLPHLTIVGHTHGGQVRLPFIKTIFAPGQGLFPKYGYGLYDYLGAKLFVSKGIGHTFFKIRFWNRPEIVILNL